MTNVLLEKDGYRYTVRCRNHAGTDAACAAVSTLCYTLAGYLHNIPELCEIEEEKLEPGDVSICFRSKDIVVGSATDLRMGYHADTVISPIFDMICVGFLQLSASYPEEADVILQEIE